MSDEQRLPGGNVGAAVRVGNTVRRTAGPWTPAVQDLLRYLEDQGFGYAPHALGVDEAGREVVDFLAGDTIGDTDPWPAWVWRENTLVQAAELTRTYHDVVRNYRPSGAVRWRFVERELAPDELICHHDIAPYNMVHRDGRIVGLFDWDLAAPGRPEEDLVQLALTIVPLTTPDVARVIGGPEDIPRRLRLLCRSYGLDDAAGFLDMVVQQAQAMVGTVRRMAAEGDVGFVRLIEGGHLARMARDAEWIRANVADWRRKLT